MTAAVAVDIADDTQSLARAAAATAVNAYADLAIAISEHTIELRAEKRSAANLALLWQIVLLNERFVVEEQSFRHAMIADLVR